MTDPRIQATARAGRARAWPPPPEHRARRCSSRPGCRPGAVAVLHTSLFGARTVVIAGAVHTTRSQILTVSGLDAEPPLIDVNAAAMQRRLDRLPWVLEAAGERRLALDRRGRRRRAGAGRDEPAVGRAATAVFDATGRVLADEAIAPGGLPLVALPGASSPAGQLARGTGAPAARRRGPAAGLAPAPGCRRSSPRLAEGVVLHLNGNVRAVVGDDQALAREVRLPRHGARQGQPDRRRGHRPEGRVRPGLDPPGQPL